MAHAADEEADNACEDKRNDEDDDQLGEVGMDECEPVAVPVMQDVGKGRIGLADVVLRSEHEKEHDGDVSVSLVRPWVFRLHNKYLSWLDDCGDLGAVNGSRASGLTRERVCERLIDLAFIKAGVA